jgi:cell division protein FtsB
LIRAITASWEDAIDSPVRVAPVVRRKVRVRRLTDAVIVAIILAASAICVEFYMRSRSELSLAVNRNQAAAERVEAQTIKLDKLERDVKALRTDPRAIELFAREKFGFIRSGDLVIRVKPSDERTPKSSDPVRVANLTHGTTAGYTDASN